MTAKREFNRATEAELRAARRLVRAAARAGYGVLEEIVRASDSDLLALRNVSVPTLRAFYRVVELGDRDQMIDVRRCMQDEHHSRARVWHVAPPADDPQIAVLEAERDWARMTSEIAADGQRGRIVVQRVPDITTDVMERLAERLPPGCPQPYVVAVPAFHPTATLVWWRGGVRDSWVWAACDILTDAGYTATPESWPSVVLCRARGIAV